MNREVAMRSWIILLTGLLTVAPPVSAAAKSPDPTEVVRTMIDAINRRDFDALDSVVAPNLSRHSAATPGVEVRNLEEFKEYLKQDLTAVPDAKQTIDVIFGCGPMVAVHATYAGTQTGPMGPFPPSGRKVELPFIGLLRVENGKITEMWVEWDNLTALAQLGHIQPPGGAEPGEGEQ
jgi:predicted ester cyclase